MPQHLQPIENSKNVDQWVPNVLSPILVLILLKFRSIDAPIILNARRGIERLTTELKKLSISEKDAETRAHFRYYLARLRGRLSLLPLLVPLHADWPLPSPSDTARPSCPRGQEFLATLSYCGS